MLTTKRGKIVEGGAVSWMVLNQLRFAPYKMVVQLIFFPSPLQYVLDTKADKLT
jgi:hypothetical protein